MALALVSTLAPTLLRAHPRQGSQVATVISVEDHEIPSNYVGSNPSDAPLQAEIHSYDIGIRLYCQVYTVRYDSGLDYLPSVFTPNHKIDIDLRKHMILVSLPGDREVKLSIARRDRAKGVPCVDNN